MPAQIHHLKHKKEVGVFQFQVSYIPHQNVNKHGSLSEVEPQHFYWVSIMFQQQRWFTAALLSCNYKAITKNELLLCIIHHNKLIPNSSVILTTCPYSFWNLRDCHITEMCTSCLLLCRLVPPSTCEIHCISGWVVSGIWVFHWHPFMLCSVIGIAILHTWIVLIAKPCLQNLYKKISK
jgi:hypothetical protein